MELDPAIRTELLGNALMLRKFALSLCGTIDGAEDLVQDTFLQALTNIDKFQPGTNLAAWLVTILRNRFLGQCRKRWREVEDIDGHYAEMLKTEPEQIARVEFGEFRAALAVKCPDWPGARHLPGYRLPTGRSREPPRRVLSGGVP